MHPWTTGTWQRLLSRREHLPHALLIHGPGGIGKLDLARRFAQLILCETANVDQPCGRCDACRWFVAGQHPDFRQIEPESLAPVVEAGEGVPVALSKGLKPSYEIKIDQIRALTDFLNIGSHRGKRRLALFHPAEAMNSSAANSILKSLEESSLNSCLILVSNNRMRLLPTIRSRCIAFPMGIPERAIGVDWLEQAQVADAADWLAFAGGAPLLAREYAASAQGAEISRLIALLRADDRESLAGVPAADREHLDLLSEIVQKWAYDQVFREATGTWKFFNDPQKARRMSPLAHKAWLRFARETGRYRIAARHPLNPKLFAADLIAKMPE